MTYRIEKVAVIGAGTMGGGIAAHLANAGIPVVLLDIPTPNLTEEEKDDPRARNRLVQSLYDRMVNARPANLASKDRANLITLGNTEDDFDLVADADWVVEVIIERLDLKQALMARLEATCGRGTIVTSNTSGIPIHELCEGRSEAFKKQFLGTHFFNPPRYLKLLELIPTEDTDPKVTDFMLKFGRDVLGKGVVICKDTPNFIANRFFSIAASYSMEYALEKGYTVPEIDAISGPTIGRPKSATFRLMDLVGLDVMQHVNSNLYDAVEDDSFREMLRPRKLTNVMEQMVANQWLGNKSGQGFYKKTFVDGNREFWALNLETMEYEPATKVRFDSIGAVRKIDDLGERLHKLLTYEDRAADFIRDTLYYGFAYAAYVTPSIAYRLSDVDDAMRWGFGHEAGPFELWDMLGVEETAGKMEQAGLEVAGWVKEMLGAGHNSFYRNGSYYDFESRSYKLKEVDKQIVVLSDLDEVERNLSASIRDMGDGVALLEFHSKMNAVDQDIIDMSHTALARLDSDFDALVIGNDGTHFCVGANLVAVTIAAQQGMWDMLDTMINGLQKATFNLLHAPKPVVTAVHQMALGGGSEYTMACWEAVAAHESYIGQTEFGVGLVPAGGGCKEILRRKINPVMRTKNADVLPVMQEAFEQIALAKVSTSAWEAKEMGYLSHGDIIVMNSDHRLAKAKERALQLVASGQRPPEIERIYAAGRDTYNAALMSIKGLQWGGYASEHDAKVAKKIAYILCGGDISAPEWVDPWYILDLEREAFLSLLGEPKTIERIMYILQTGKPLRN